VLGRGGMYRRRPRRPNGTPAQAFRPRGQRLGSPTVGSRDGGGTRG
jgi:hypothetical protein